MSTTDTININRLLSLAFERKSSNIHFLLGSYPVLRISDKLISLTDEPVIDSAFINSLMDYFLTDDLKTKLTTTSEVDFMFSRFEQARIKVSVYKQKGGYALSLKIIDPSFRSVAELNLPPVVEKLAQAERGLVIISGPVNCGKNNTLYAIIQAINTNKSKHVVIIEQHSEKLFVSDKSLVEQREVGVDVPTFSQGLATLLDEDVDVVASSALPDEDSLKSLLNLVETGKLVFVLTTYQSAVSCFDAIVNELAVDTASWARTVIGDSLIAVLAQALIPTIEGGLLPAVEILLGTDSVKNLIKEGKFSQIRTILQTSREEGMISFDRAVVELAEKGKISTEAALAYAHDSAYVKRSINKAR